MIRYITLPHVSVCARWVYGRQVQYFLVCIWGYLAATKKVSQKNLSCSSASTPLGCGSIAEIQCTKDPLEDFRDIVKTTRFLRTTTSEGLSGTSMSDWSRLQPMLLTSDFEMLRECFSSR